MAAESIVQFLFFLKPKFQAISCVCRPRFVVGSFGNSEDRFFHDNAHIYHNEAYLNCFYLIYVFVLSIFRLNHASSKKEICGREEKSAKDADERNKTELSGKKNTTNQKT